MPERRGRGSAVARSLIRCGARLARPGARGGKRGHVGRFCVTSNRAGNRFNIYFWFCPQRRAGLGALFRATSFLTTVVTPSNLQKHPVLCISHFQEAAIKPVSLS